tara:strand:+ start:5334 stop:5462 length:129 start_codon:yes stop_codon:yes gene_type:complete
MKKDEKKKTKNQKLFDDADVFAVEEMLVKQKLRDAEDKSKSN